MNVNNHIPEKRSFWGYYRFVLSSVFVWTTVDAEGGHPFRTTKPYTSEQPPSHNPHIDQDNRWRLEVTILQTVRTTICVIHTLSANWQERRRTLPASFDDLADWWYVKLDDAVKLHFQALWDAFIARFETTEDLHKMEQDFHDLRCFTGQISQ